MKTLLMLTLLLTHFHFAIASSPQTQYVDRYALFVGANFGGKERERLRYAQTDAEALAKVLETLGGVRKDSYHLLREPEMNKVIHHLVELEKKVRLSKQQGRRTEVLFYYSGHADPEGLLLGDERMAYRVFRYCLDKINADVRIAVLDSCYSGAFTRLKGGQRYSPFLMADKEKNVKGHAFITSSSHDEESQESDLIGGSFFTHFLVSGLRGAADLSADGKVTLNEAYQYAYHETLARTENTEGGPQHPGYNMQLSGVGDLILTDIRNASSTLNLSEDLEGKVYIRNQNGQLVSEVYKQEGKVLLIGVEPGEYKVNLIKSEGLFQSQMKVEDEKNIRLSMADFQLKDPEAVSAKGEGSEINGVLRKPRGVVMPLQANNVSSIEAEITTELLRKYIKDQKKIQLMDMETIKNVLKEQEFEVEDCFSKDCVIEIGKLANADKMIYGEMKKKDAQYEIAIHMINMDTLSIEKSIKELTSSFNKIDEVLERASHQLFDSPLPLNLEPGLELGLEPAPISELTSEPRHQGKKKRKRKTNRILERWLGYSSLTSLVIGGTLTGLSQYYQARFNSKQNEYKRAVSGFDEIVKKSNAAAEKRDRLKSLGIAYMSIGGVLFTGAMVAMVGRRFQERKQAKPVVLYPDFSKNSLALKLDFKF